jgi:hypothetical protein
MRCAFAIRVRATFRDPGPYRGNTVLDFFEYKSMLIVIDCGDKLLRAGRSEPDRRPSRSADGKEAEVEIEATSAMTCDYRDPAKVTFSILKC